MELNPEVVLEESQVSVVRGTTAEPVSMCICACREGLLSNSWGKGLFAMGSGLKTVVLT